MPSRFEIATLDMPPAASSTIEARVAPAGFSPSRPRFECGTLIITQCNANRLRPATLLSLLAVVRTRESRLHRIG
jgi:hypothetical protein